MFGRSMPAGSLVVILILALVSSHYIPKLFKPSLEQTCIKGLTGIVTKGLLNPWGDACRDHLDELISSGKAEKIEKAQNLLFTILKSDRHRKVNFDGPFFRLADHFENSTAVLLFAFHKNLENVIFPKGKLLPSAQFEVQNSNLIEPALRLLSFYRTEEYIGPKTRALVNLSPLFNTKLNQKEHALVRIQTFIMLGRYDDAKKSLAKVLPQQLPSEDQLTPEVCKLYIQEGEILRETGQLDKAVAKMNPLIKKLQPLKKSFESCRFDAEALQAFALIMMDHPNALEAIRQVERLPMSYAKKAAKPLYARYYRRKNNVKSLDYAKQSADENGDSLHPQYSYYAEREKLLSAIRFKDKANYTQTRKQLVKLMSEPQTNVKNKIFLKPIFQIGDAHMLGKSFDKNAFKHSISELEKTVGTNNPMVSEIKDLKTPSKKL